MHFCFDKKLVREWAEFSQDFNPIHFDEDKARALGCSGLTVHGMLVLQVLKAASMRELVVKEGKWLVVKALFREAVLLDANYTMLVKQKMDETRFHLMSIEDGQVSIDGRQYFEACSDVVSFTGKERYVYEVTEAFLNAKQAELPSLLKGKCPIWLFLDSAVFAHFVHDEILFFWVRRLIGFEWKASQYDLLSEVRVLQTSHLISLSPQMMSWTSHDWSQLGKLKYISPKPMVYSIGLQEVVMQFIAYIYCDDVYVARVEMGVLIQTVPDNANRLIVEGG